MTRLAMLLIGTLALTACQGSDETVDPEPTLPTVRHTTSIVAPTTTRKMTTTRASTTTRRPTTTTHRSRPRSTGPHRACAAGYSPCLPIVADLDCADIAGPVVVTGSDPYRLDRDGDGIGCD